MDHTVVHFEIPADDPERAAKFYRELFGWDINRWEGAASGVSEYWMVKTVPTDAAGQPTAPGVNGGLMRRMMPGQLLSTMLPWRASTSPSGGRSGSGPRSSSRRCRCRAWGGSRS